MPKLLFCVLTTYFLSTSLALDCVYHKYCVVGAGPGGLQIGYFLHYAARDYVVFEASNKSGSFFERYPRHRKLISINKRHTGKVNPEFNLRHDWNSLLSHDDDLRATKYSKEIFPNAEVLLDYLNDFQRKLNINVQFNTKIQNIHKIDDPSIHGGTIFRMNDQHHQCYTCKILIVATGISTPNIPNIPGIDLAHGYETISTDASDFEGKSVLILGRGNSAFETAARIYGATNSIHMISRSRVRLAWSTHYVGDLRAVNNDLLDTYQLKSLDGLLEVPVERMALMQDGNKIYFKGISDCGFVMEGCDNNPFRVPFDLVIRALGFKFDHTLFSDTDVTGTSKYPAIHNNYESVSLKDLFFAGTATHSLDFRKSAGGFIHGFRYTARALHRLLEWRYEGIPWPSVTIPVPQLLNTILKRINEASGLYQMFQYMGDIAVLSEDGETVKYIEEFPVDLLDQLFQLSGINASSVLVIVMEYGKNFSAPESDVFRIDRATAESSFAHVSNFLHPVVYYYKNLPTAQTMNLRKQGSLPRPDKIHHVLEDFLTLWDGPESHTLPLRRFLEAIWQTDQRTFFSQICFQLVMTHSTLPQYCTQQYLKGGGLLCTKQMSKHVQYRM